MTLKLETKRVLDDLPGRHFITEELDRAINSLNPGIGRCLKRSGRAFRKLLRKLSSYFLQHNYTPKSMVTGEIKQTLKKL